MNDLVKLTILAIVLLQVAPLQPKAPAQPRSHDSNTQSQQAPLQPLIINEVDNRQPCNKCGQKHDVSTQDPNKYIRRGFWVNLIIALLTCVLAIASLLQASAGKKMAHHLLAAERAWLTASVTNPDPEPDSNFIWVYTPITNSGKTPAQITRIAVTPIFVLPDLKYIGDYKPGKLPATPPPEDYERTNVLSGYSLIIAPGDVFSDLPTYIHPSEWEKVKARKHTLYVHCKIEYRDTVEGSAHETWFCAIYNTPLPKFNEPTGFMFTQYIPKSYFRAT